MRQSTSMPPRGPLTSRTRTVTRSIERAYFPSFSPSRRRMYARSSSSSRTPSTRMCAGVSRAAVRPAVRFTGLGTWCASDSRFPSFRVRSRSRSRAALPAIRDRPLGVRLTSAVSLRIRRAGARLRTTATAAATGAPSVSVRHPCPFGLRSALGRLSRVLSAQGTGGARDKEM